MKKNALLLIGILMVLSAMPLKGHCTAPVYNAEKIDSDWLFSLSDDSSYATPSFDDSKWRKLNLPHDWSIEGELSPSLASCTGYLPGGIAWYRKHLTLTSNDLTDAMRLHKYLYFEGVYNRSEVYVNGSLLGKRPNGCVSFYYEMTPYLHEGDNIIAVRVDHSRYADSRWYTGSGIYRDVWMIEKPECHLSIWGTGYTTKVSGKKATLSVTTQVENADKAKSALNVLVEVFDAEGSKVAEKKQKYSSAKISCVIPEVKLWSLDTPYLYKVKTTLLDGTTAIDCHEMNAGVRTISFDPDKGFALNGRNMKIKGVCIHHDAGTLGAVVPEDVWHRRLLHLKAIGANAIRCAHNPQSPVLYDLCDRLGLLVMDEASDEWEFPKRKWVKGWNVGEPSFDGTFDFFEEWIERDVTDMVRRDRNHPSIIFWSIGNEVDYPNDPYSHPVLDGGNAVINQPMFGGYDPKRPNAERIGKIAKRLAACVRSIDTSRPVTGALAGVVMSNHTEYPEAVDVVGYNYTENRYDEDHKTYPQRVIYGSENGVGYDAWCAVRDKEFISGQFIWTGLDYLGESGRWPSRGLNTGLLDFGGYAKPRGWFRASLWSEKPMCYIGTYPARGGRRGGQNLSAEALDTWNYDEMASNGGNIRVVCYTNCAQARLTLNGEVVGEAKPYDMKTGIIHWDIPYKPGELKAIAMDKEGNDVASYTITTTGRPYAIRATLDNGYNSAPGQSDIDHLLIEVVDETGNVVRLADNNITCRIEGPAQLLGLEGSDNTDMGNYHDNRQRVHNGRLLAYVKNTRDKSKGAPQTKIILSSPLLKGCTFEY